MAIDPRVLTRPRLHSPSFFLPFFRSLQKHTFFTNSFFGGFCCFCFLLFSKVAGGEQALGELLESDRDGPSVPVNSRLVDPELRPVGWVVAQPRGHRVLPVVPWARDQGLADPNVLNISQAEIPG